MNFLKNSYSSMPSEKGKLDASVAMALVLLWCDTLASSTRFFLFKFVKILDADELFALHLSMIMLIPRAGV